MNNKEEWKLEELWDWIASEIGFDGKGNEIQDGIREFVKLKLASQSKSMIEEVLKDIKNFDGDSDEAYGLVHKIKESITNPQQ